jgi:site-specific DNA-methyltransferase (adenine-specific)
MISPAWKNKLYYGDNLNILRVLGEETIDLIYLDPPFNSNATYNVLFEEKGGEQSAAQITAFGDTWHWGNESEDAYHEVVTQGPRKLGELMQALRLFLGQNDMMAYLIMMAERLVELHRVLNRTGSIYLHCDPTASHYLKILMDAIFGNSNFMNELIWYYRGAGIPKMARAKRHDVLLVYAKHLGSHYFNPDPIRRPYASATVERFSHHIGNVRGGRDYGTQKLNPRGKHPDDVITDIQPIAPSAKARLGYPTQKPEELLKEIIESSSAQGKLVLDPFCGCGTAIAAAEHLGRSWIGIDITHLAISLIRHRLHNAFGRDLRPYEVIGDPKDLASAGALAQENRYQFEWWALGLVDARPAHDKRKGADQGVDGYVNFFDDASGRAKKIVVQVKSGHVNVSHIRDLKGVLEREKAPIGVFITLEKPTRPMVQEATAAGFYVPEHFADSRYSRVQILTIQELLNGKEMNCPKMAPSPTFRRAPRSRRSEGQQHPLV